MAVAAPEIKELELAPSSEIRFDAGFASTLHDIQALPEAGTDTLRAVSVAELPGDAELVAEAQRGIRTRLVGETALSETVEAVKPIRNIREGFIWAERGDAEGRNMAKANIRKEANERIYKAGNVVSAHLEVDMAGNIYQFGQNTDDIHRNAYQMASEHPVIKERTVAEANNNARIKNELKKGTLKDNYLVVASICAEGLSDEELDKLNFFSLTKSMSIQATTETESGLLMESAFVAGVKDENSERHDRKVIEAWGESLGVDYKGKSAAEIINMPVLVPKSVMPNGVVDMVKIMDEINEGTFFGQGKPRQDYVEFKRFCEEREAGFEEDVDMVYDQLLNELIDLPTAAVLGQRLGKLVGLRMVDRAINDSRIDSRVFGSTSSEHIETARVLQARGMYAEAAQHKVVALLTETSGSCPSAMNSLSMLSVGDQQKYMMSGATEAILVMMAERAKKGWHGGEIKDGECVGCDKKTKVGVKNYCRDCINC